MSAMPPTDEAVSRLSRRVETLERELAELRDGIGEREAAARRAELRRRRIRIALYAAVGLAYVLYIQQSLAGL